jgi:serine/threonine protein kinase
MLTPGWPMKWMCATCDAAADGKRPTVCPSCDSPQIVLDLRGRLLGERYRLERLIGIGSQDSTVWKALQISVDRAVAVKVMPGGRDLAMDRFARGAKLASMLSHPHITITHDFGETRDGYVYLVMELLQGRSLRSELGNTPSLPVDRALHITNQVLAALEAAHAEQIVHRDLKPDNLFLSPAYGDGDYVKVLDFGIAKFFEEERAGGAMETTMEGQITRGWQLCGTPLYMAPEQINGDPVDARTDVYALGIVLYQLLVGHPPFRAKTQAAVLSQHLRDKPQLISSARPDLRVSDSLERLVMRAVAKSPSDRFASAREMRHVLQAVQKDLGLRVDTTAEIDERHSATTPSAVRTHGATVTISSKVELAKPPAGSRRWTFVLLALVAVFGYWAATGGEARESPLGTNVTVDVPWEQGKSSEKRRSERPRGSTGVTSITLLSVPSGAKVWSGDTPFGDTPITVSLPSSKMHSLDLVLAGYQTHTAVVDLAIMDPGVPIELRIDLKPMDSVEHARPRNTGRSKRDLRVRRPVIPRAERAPAKEDFIDPRAPRSTPRIETLDSPSRTRTGTPGKRKLKIDLLE